MGILNLTYIKNINLYPKGYTILINANLTDNMNNPITNQNINLIINGTLVSSIVSEEGSANFTYTFNGPGVYEGNGKFPIKI